MKKLCLTLYIFFTCFTLNAQNYEWVSSFEGNIEIVSSIEHDFVGNAYITGEFSGTFDADPGPGTYNLTATPSSSFYAKDIFIAKYSPNGDFVWAFPLGSFGFDGGKSLLFDGSGAIYVTGFFQESIDFDPSPSGTHILTNMSTGGFPIDLFLAKYDLDGNFLSAFSLAAENGSLEGLGLALDPLGNIVLGGRLAGAPRDNPTMDLDPHPTNTHLISLSPPDPFNSGSVNNLFVATYSNTGTFVSAFSLPGTGGSQLGAITIDQLGNILITGDFFSKIDLDPGLGNNSFTANGRRERDIFVAKYDAAGNHMWGFGIGGTSVDRGADILTDAIGNVYVTGSYTGRVPIDFDPGSGTNFLTTGNGGNGFIAKYAPNGNHIWALGIAPVTRDISPSSIDFDPMGNLIITGGFNGEVDFDPGIGDATLIADIRDLFIAKYTSFGAFHSVISEFTPNASVFASSTALDPSGNIFVAGTINNPTPSMLGPCEVPSFHHVNGGFLVKYDPNPSPSICDQASNYSGANIGNTSGSTTENAGVYTLNASGTGIKGTTDGFHFAADEGSGDIDLIARVTGIQNNASRQAGLMLRECLGPDAPNVAIVVNGQKQVKMTRRDTEGGTTITVATKAARRRLNSWLRLTLTGTGVVGYYSQNGTVWEYVGTASFEKASCGYSAGLAASKGATGATKTFTFDNFMVNGVAPDADPPRLANNSDAMNHVAIVAYPNPFGDQLSYRLEGVEGEATVRLLDMAGRVITTVEPLESNGSTAVINTSKIAAGIYFLEVRTADERKLVKVVKK